MDQDTFVLFEQGCLHYTPEHCLVNGGFPLFWWKSHVSNGQHVSFKEPCEGGVLSRKLPSPLEPSKAPKVTFGPSGNQGTVWHKQVGPKNKAPNLGFRSFWNPLGPNPRKVGFVIWFNIDSFGAHLGVSHPTSRMASHPNPNHQPTRAFPKTAGLPLKPRPREAKPVGF